MITFGLFQHAQTRGCFPCLGTVFKTSHTTLSISLTADITNSESTGPPTQKTLNNSQHTTTFPYPTLILLCLAQTGSADLNTTDKSIRDSEAEYCAIELKLIRRSEKLWKG